MIDKIRASRSWQLFAIAALIFLMPLVVDLNGRIGTIRQARAEAARMSKTLEQARQEQQALRDMLDYIASDAYLEQWARVEARMVKTDEVGIIPIWTHQAADASGADQQNPTTTPDDTTDISAQWHRLFFEEPAAP